MTDQGKPSVCPTCGKPKFPEGKTLCFDQLEEVCEVFCMGHPHSSPIPAATPKPSQEEYDQLIWHNCAGICSCEECRNYRDKYVSAPQAESPAGKDAAEIDYKDSQIKALQAEVAALSKEKLLKRILSLTQRIEQQLKTIKAKR